MDRRTFLQKTVILGGGMAVLPALHAVPNSVMEVVPLATEPQIRHGLLSLNTVVYKDWLASLQKNIFYKNGQSPSEEDLLTYSFVHQNKAYLIGIKERNIVLSIDGESINLNSEGTVLYQDKNIALARIENYQTIDVSNQSVILPIKKKTIVNSHRLEEQLLWLSQGSHALEIDDVALQLSIF